MQTCTKCHQPTETFPRQNSKWCATCHVSYMKAYREQNKVKLKEQRDLNYKTNREEILKKCKEWNYLHKEEVRERCRQYRQRNKDALNARQQAYRNQPEVKFQHYKRNAEKRNLSFELTFEQFMVFWQIPCHYCGATIASVRLDRIDNEIGYTNNNVVSCCRECNFAKSSRTAERFIEHSLQIAKHQHNAC